MVDAVIRAISPGLQLRSYLEGKPNMTLPTLRRILRSHFQEKSATELYKQLSSESQGNKETPQNFLMRVLDLRQKILFASQEAESGLKYDPALVQSMFLHTVLTGLQSDSIIVDIQPLRLDPKTTDEALLEKLNRQMKQCSQCKKVLYCSKICQTHHWAEHKRTCIKSTRSVSNFSRTMSIHTTCSTQVNQQSPVTSLVGRQCLVECYLHGQRCQALWDTGSQVCVIDEVWKQEYLPEVPLRDVSDILEAPNTLNLVAANGIDMPYIGYVEVTFNLSSQASHKAELVIPMLVARGQRGHLSHHLS